jgi:hypothetical protein
MLAVIYAECRVFYKMLCANVLNARLQDAERRVFNNMLSVIMMDGIYAECRGTSGACTIKNFTNS